MEEPPKAEIIWNGSYSIHEMNSQIVAILIDSVHIKFFDFDFALFCLHWFQPPECLGCINWHQNMAVDVQAAILKRPDIRVWSARVRQWLHCKIYSINCFGPTIFCIFCAIHTTLSAFIYFALHSNVKSIETQSIFIVWLSASCSSVKIYIVGLSECSFLVFPSLSKRKITEQNNYAQLKWNKFKWYWPLDSVSWGFIEFSIGTFGRSCIVAIILLFQAQNTPYV